MMNNLNFCGMFEDLTINGINKASGSEAPVFIAEEEEKEFKADELWINAKEVR